MPEYAYNIGDWIVHIEQGIGQIKEKESRLLAGIEKDVYKVKTLTGIYRIPVEELEADHIRPLASDEEIDQGLSLIQEPPHKLPNTLKAREEEISRVRQGISIRAKAQIIRDLHGESIFNQISITEEFFLIKFKKEFTNELSVIKQETTDQAEEIIEEALAISVSKNSIIQEE